MSELSQAKLAAMRKAGCKVPLLVYPASIGMARDEPRDTFGQPPVPAVMQWIQGKLPSSGYERFVNLGYCDEPHEDAGGAWGAATMLRFYLDLLVLI